MAYKQALDYIHSTYKFGSKLGLENIKKLLDLLGNPQNTLKIIHIAGTNGKGSTTAMTSNVLIEKGYKVGYYISPFIDMFNERICINNIPISNSDLATFTGIVKEKVDIMLDEGYNHPTEFEIITALGYLYFQKENCDYVVVEVGMGGRFDATNVIEHPILTVITSISLDHTMYLGDTIEKIAFEKCGIIKENIPVICYNNQPSLALETIISCAKEKNAQLIIADKSAHLSTDLTGNTFSIGELSGIKTSLIGNYQANNAATVVAIIKELNIGFNLGISRDNIYNGIAKTKWTGRFEVISNNPTVIIDGGHNADGVDKFIETLHLVNTDKKEIHIIMGMMADKEYEKSAEKLAKIAKTFIGVTVPRPKAVSGEVLYNCGKNFCENAYTHECVKDAVEFVYGLSNKDDLICIIGSLYMISTAKDAIKLHNFSSKLSFGKDNFDDYAAVRENVFVDEQGFAEEFDTIDEHCQHVVIYDNATTRPIATGRTFVSKNDIDTYVVGRVAVLKDYRGNGIGEMVIDILEKKIVELGVKNSTLSSQMQAKGFYEKLGYSPVGDIYLDEHCPHIKMMKQLL